MSFGLGLVKGLVGGFTRNIQEERQARATDDQRLAALEDTLFAAALDPKKKIPQELGNMLKDAKTKLEGRESIDLFGREGPRLRLDIDKLQSIANSVDGDGMIKIGTYVFPGSKAYFDAKNTYDQSREYWTSLQNHIAVPENLIAFRTHFQNTPSDLSFLNADFKRNRKYYLNGYTLRETPKGKDGEMKSLVRTTMEDFKLGSIMDLYDGNNDSSDESEALEESYSQFLNNNKMMALSKGAVFFPYKKDGKKLAYAYKPEEDELTALQLMATDYGYKGKLNKFLFDYASNFAPDGIYEGDIDDEEKTKVAYGYLFHAMELRKLKINDPNMIKQPEIMDYLDQTFGSNDAKKVLAMSIAMPKPVRPGSELEANGVITAGMSRDQELLGILGKGLSKADFNKGYDAVIKARNQLKQLLQLRQKIKLSDGLVEEMYKIGFGLFGTGGQVSQFATLLGNQSEDDASEFDKTIRKAFNVSSADELGKIEALKIELAFTLARAADPSGRLSNQDFEVQLRRLGTTGIFTNIPSQVSAIETVLEDTQNMLERKTLLYRILNKPAFGKSNVLSDKERRTVYASKQFHQIRRETREIEAPLSRAKFIGNADDKNSAGNPLYIPDPNNPENVLNTDTLETHPKSHIKNGDKII